ncbi:MAG: hypothetical protein MK212_20640 [Saprospiraceae bacterium]|nr:hypothetical protein [Saprospiraceae bacterium]
MYQTEVSNLFQLLESTDLDNFELGLILIQHYPDSISIIQERYRAILQLFRETELNRLFSLFQRFRTEGISTIYREKGLTLLDYLPEDLNIGLFPDTQLYLHDHKLESLPNNFGYLAALKRLGLERNYLTTLPISIGKLLDLEYLNLSDNLLKNLPISLGELHNLKYLFLQNNNLEYLPQNMHQLYLLKELNLRGNPISSKEIQRLRKSLPDCRITI